MKNFTNFLANHSARHYTSPLLLLKNLVGFFRCTGIGFAEFALGRRIFGVFAQLTAGSLLLRTSQSKLFFLAGNRAGPADPR